MHGRTKAPAGSRQAGCTPKRRCNCTAAGVPPPPQACTSQRPSLERFEAQAGPQRIGLRNFVQRLLLPRPLVTLALPGAGAALAATPLAVVAPPVAVIPPPLAFVAPPVAAIAVAVVAAAVLPAAAAPPLPAGWDRGRRHAAVRGGNAGVKLTRL